MDLSKVVKVTMGDQHKIADSRRKQGVKKSLRKRLMDTETTEDAVAVATEALADEEPSEVLEAVVEILGGTIDELETQLADSKKKKNVIKAKKVIDSLKKKLMDTDTTEDAVSVAVEALQDAEPEDVIEATIEVLGGVIDDLQNPPTE